MNPEQRQTYIVETGEQGLRLDVFLARRDPSLSRSRVQRLIEQGAVRSGGRPVRPSHKVRKGETIDCAIAPANEYDVVPEDIPLSVIYEDASLLVVDKPAGMVVHPAAGHHQGTLVHAMLFHCWDLSGIGGVLRPGIVHRLDKDTSGLIMAAKSDRAHQALTEQFKLRQVKKTYLALAYGDVKEDQGLIDLPVGRHPQDRKKMSTQSRRGREAATRWQVQERYGAATLLEVDIETGRTHQIRVHLHAIGHPVVGDSVYGGARRVNAVAEPLLRAVLKTMKRQALHSAHLSFSHPLTGDALAFSSSPPADMAQLCDALRRLTGQ
ncbi:MAG: RluA family pseudouridine synthase [Deltaproteobacteria bacterium HGW-Deltaproteobacteria-11]|nr:MAG: RluA family pseudouridine synthase [Deltaproteobacteria bacterium HGW-Deltaproteobacteria-11]